MQCMPFSNDIEFEIVLENKPLSQVSGITFFGLSIDISLNWKSHF